MEASFVDTCFGPMVASTSEVLEGHPVQRVGVDWLAESHQRKLKGNN